MSTFARCGAMLAPFVPLLVGRIWLEQSSNEKVNILIFIGQLLWAIALAAIWRNILIGWLIIALVAGNLSQKTTRYGKVKVKNTCQTSNWMWICLHRSLKPLRWEAEKRQLPKILITLYLPIFQSRSRNLIRRIYEQIISISTKHQ